MANAFVARPGMKSRVWSRNQTPPINGGNVEWVGDEHEMLWQLGKRKITKKSGKGYTICHGGPYHNRKIKTEFYLTAGKKKNLAAEMPKEFALKPYAGRYVYNETEDAYIWTTK